MNRGLFLSFMNVADQFIRSIVYYLYKPVLQRNVDPSTHYDLVGKLGEGAFGDVWKAKNKITQKYSAAKIIEISSESEIEEHYGEIEILIKCNHRNIVDCVDSIYWESKLWILIEYCEGGALDDIIEKIDHGDGLSQNN